MTALDPNTDLLSLDRRIARHIDEAAWLKLADELIPAGQPAAENPLDPDRKSVV